MAVKQILEKYYEGLSTDVKPTGVIDGSVFRETDTRANYTTYNGDDMKTATAVADTAIVHFRYHTH